MSEDQKRQLEQQLWNIANNLRGEGERKKGFGQIEFYVEGTLLLTLPVSRNKNLDLISCNAP